MKLNFDDNDNDNDDDDDDDDDNNNKRKQIVIKNPQMRQTLNADPNDNSDWINHTEHAKEYLFKYYNRLDNTERKKRNSNRNKELRYKK
jgi:hypothetical protein